MLHLSYLFGSALGPFGRRGDGAVGAAAIGSGADPTELMEDAGMIPETRADRYIDKPLARAKRSENGPQALDSAEPFVPMARVR